MMSNSTTANKLTMAELLQADKPLRQGINKQHFSRFKQDTGLELLGKCHDHAKYSRNPNQKLLSEKFSEVQKILQVMPRLFNSC